MKFRSVENVHWGLKDHRWILHIINCHSCERDDWDHENFTQMGKVPHFNNKRPLPTCRTPYCSIAAIMLFLKRMKGIMRTCCHIESLVNGGSESNRFKFKSMHRPEWQFLRLLKISGFFNKNVRKGHVSVETSGLHTQYASFRLSLGLFHVSCAVRHESTWTALCFFIVLFDCGMFKGGDRKSVV